MPAAANYFPDLTLKDGKVHRRDASGLKSLEIVTNVLRPNGKYEDQIVGFMSYLNPDTLNAGEIEALNGARLMHWLLNDPDAVAASVKVALAILRRKVRAQASRYKLTGKDPRLAIWASDIRHQNRGSDEQIKIALAAGTLAERLEQIAAIGEGKYASRIASVRRSIRTLQNEGRFDGVVLGDASLPL